MRKNNRSMWFGPLWSLIQMVRPGTVAGCKATLTPGVSRPVHDKGAQAHLSGEAGNKRRCDKGAQAHLSGALTGSDLSGTALAEKNSFYPSGSSTERYMRDKAHHCAWGP